MSKKLSIRINQLQKRIKTTATKNKYVFTAEAKDGN